MRYGIRISKRFQNLVENKCFFIQRRWFIFRQSQIFWKLNFNNHHNRKNLVYYSFPKPCKGSPWLSQLIASLPLQRLRFNRKTLYVGLAVVNEVLVHVLHWVLWLFHVSITPSLLHIHTHLSPKLSNHRNWQRR